MRYPASEKSEIIALVEQSHLPARRTLEKLGVPRATFYRWYDRYREGGIEALADQLRRGADPGELAPLCAFEARHRREAGPLYAGTNALVRFFTDDRAPVLALRRAVIDLARHLPPLRAAITRRLVDAG